jgi:hypothetical protein
MSQESERMLELLQEVAALKEAGDSENGANATACRQRRKEISEEIKQLARSKKKGKQ